MIIPRTKAGQPPDRASLWLALTEHAPLPMAMVEGAGHVMRHVNPAFCLLMDKSTEQLVGRSLRKILQEKGECITLLDRVFQTGKAESHTEQEGSKPHPLFWCYTVWPVRAGKQPLGVIIEVTETAKLHEQTVAMNEALVLGSLRQHELTETAHASNVQLQKEITERKLAEQALLQAHAQLADRAGQLEALVAERTVRLQETVAELEAFSYGIAHDMRAPLRAMAAFGALVQAEQGAQLDENGREYLGRIVSAAQRLDRLITDVLSYGTASRRKLDLQAVDLEALLEQTIRNQPEFQAPQAEIQIHRPLHKVIAHEPSLIRCVTNLFCNAVKFVSPGVTPRIAVRSELAGPEVRLWFEDNGIGISPADQERIFAFLGRLNPVEEFEGTGIGLTIVRKSVERMGGKVGVESELGQGSRFWIQLKGNEEV